MTSDSPNFLSGPRFVIPPEWIEKHKGDKMKHQFKPWQPVVVRGSDDGRWRADFFSYYNEEASVRPFMCTSGIRYKYCLPAEGNEHLVGTKVNPTPPEPKFNFGDMVEVRDAEGNQWKKARFIAYLRGPYPYYVFFEREDSIELFKYCRHAKQEG